MVLLLAPGKPQILQQPVDTSSEIGGVALFKVKATYHLELSYQWYFQPDKGASKTIQGSGECLSFFFAVSVVVSDFTL